MSVSKRIYMDNHATTPMDPGSEAMLSLPGALRQRGELNHAFGWGRKTAVD